MRQGARGGERIVAGGRELEVAYTPGHASHHVSYFDRATRIAFVGDTAGIRRASGAYVMPPTPPPDIDLDLWRASIERILAWDPETLFLTHFGAFRGARPHFEELMRHLDEWSLIARRLLADSSLDDGMRERRFVEDAMIDLRRAVGDQEADMYSRAGRIDYSWQGLSRVLAQEVGLTGCANSAPAVRRCPPPNDLRVSVSPWWPATAARGAAHACPEHHRGTETRRSLRFAAIQDWRRLRELSTGGSTMPAPQ